MAENEKENEKNDRKKTNIPALEWFFAAVGLILVVGVLGFLIYHAIIDKGTPPNLNVKIDSIVQRENGFLVKFVIENTGDETAADVNVEGELKKGAETIETSGVTVDYVPSHSEKKGGLFFKEKSGGFEIELHAKGYNTP